MSLSPREVSILALLAQKAKEQTVNIEELGLSDAAKKLANALLSKKSGSTSKPPCSSKGDRAEV